MEQKIKEIMAAVFEVSVDAIGEDTSIDSLESWDSLKHMELIAALEQATGAQFTADEIVSMVSFVKVRQVLEGKELG